MKRAATWIFQAWKRLQAWLWPSQSNIQSAGQSATSGGRSGTIFVYGTLRRGQPDHHLLEANVTKVEEATIPGIQYFMPDGSRTVVAGVDRVAGQLLTCANLDEVLKQMDGIEGCDPLRTDNFVERIQVRATTADGVKHSCYVYVCSEEKRAWLVKHGERIPSDWTRWEPDEKLVAYFAYGSCMSHADFNRTVPDFEVMGMAELPDYQLAFTRYAKSRKGGVADIVPLKGHLMEGVLYRFPRRFLKALDKREGVPTGVYERILVNVRYDGMKVPVWTYAVVEKAKQEIPPSQVYRDIILAGAEEALSEAYRERLREKMDRLMGEEGKG